MATATKRKTEHVVFRNGHPFCTNCGRSYEMNLPAPIDIVTAVMDAFVKMHKNCPKTWVEPTAETNGKTESENANWWLANGWQGISSKTMYSVLRGQALLAKDRYSHPRDPADFNRCHLLLEAVPQWRARLDELKALGDPWPALVDNWDKLTAMLLEQKTTNKANGMYEFMRELGT